MLSTLRNQHQHQYYPSPYPYHTAGLGGSPLTPRERYLASLAEVEAAQADLIAAEAEKEREEEEEEELLLRRRLREIEAHRHRRPRYEYPSASASLYHHHHDRYSSASEDRLTLLRRELEEEELRAARTQHRVHSARERERELLLRREAERIALLRQQEENRLELARRQREQEERRLLELRRRNSRAARFVDEASIPKVSQACPRRNVTNDHKRSPTFDLESLIAQVSCSQKAQARVTPPKAAVSRPNPDEFLRALFGGQEEQSQQSRPATQPSPAKPAREEASVATPEDFLTLLLGGVEKPTQKASTGLVAGSASLKTDTVKAHQAPEDPRDFLRVFLGGRIPVAEKQVNKKAAEPSRQPSGSIQQTKPGEPTPKRPSSPTTSLKEQLEARLGNDEAVEIKDTIQAIVASLADAASRETQAPSSAPASMLSAGPSTSTSSSSNVKVPERPSSPSTTVKEQLHARLGGDEAVEIRDTIQAILASLADAARYEAQAPSAPTKSGSASTPAPASSSSGKGKKRADSTPPAATPSSEPTSNDVLKSMNTVDNIAAAFSALQQDFVFPSRLDFTPTSSAASSPVSSDTESSAGTIGKLAYTSRNHPVRYYEQGLTGLLSQLDGVESFGNGEVRMRRKEVVARVEGALDELEREVEGRWKVRVASERKEAVSERASLTRDAAAAIVEDSIEIAAPPADEESLASTSVEVSDTKEEPAEYHKSPSVEVETTPVPENTENTHSEFKLHQEPELEAQASILLADRETAERSGDSHVEAVTETHGATSPASESGTMEDPHAVAEEQSSVGVDPVLQEQAQDSTPTYGFYLPSQSILTTIEDTTNPSTQYPPSTAPSTTSSAAASVATIRPYDVDVETASTSSEEEDEKLQRDEVESDSDGFLLSEKVPEEDAGKKRKLEEDVGSDWSEVEA
ncbi:hypothetical protein PQX77_010018 [Marasmius sp. AFHP31]|nr:hypothetical protein PQX77_010018 [Marasmius sp. AFHP31]